MVTWSVTDGGGTITAAGLYTAPAVGLHSLTFWSTPDGGGTGVDNAYPFAIEDYLPPPQ